MWWPLGSSAQYLSITITQCPRATTRSAPRAKRWQVAAADRHDMVLARKGTADCGCAAQPALVLGDYRRTIAVNPDPKRIAPFAASSDVDRILMAACRALVQNLAHLTLQSIRSIFPSDAARRGRQQAAGAKGAGRDRSHAQDTRGRAWRGPTLSAAAGASLKPLAFRGKTADAQPAGIIQQVRGKLTAGGHRRSTSGNRASALRAVVRRPIASSP